MRKRLIIILWSILLIVTVCVATAFWAINSGKIGYMPPIDHLQNPVNKYASQVISADGKLLGTWSFSADNRIFVDYKGVSPYLINALIATEDKRFYEHSGIDGIGLTRAIIKTGLLRQESAGGGSTLTQQLAKQLYSEKASSTLERIFQKPIEWVIAVQLEKAYTKEEIITMYLNYFDFLHNAVGIKTAAKTYFGKDPSELTVPESALLVGMCKNPSYYNPVRFSERAKGRRNVVLDLMRRNGYISKAEYNQYREQELGLKFHRLDHKEGLAAYLRGNLRTMLMAKKPEKDQYETWQKQKYYEDSLAWEKDPLYGWCNKNKKRDGSFYNIYNDGLRIYTTIDSRMQQYAEEAAFEHVAKFLQPQFDKEKKGRTNAPYSNQVSKEKIQQILAKSMRQSERYRLMKKAGKSDAEIEKAFHTKQEMSVFTYNGVVDTVMTPMDSIRYYKMFLRTGFFSMDAQNGHVKAYVGGLDYRYFQYDMAMVGRRQVGSTVKPFLYALAMENGFTPCDQVLNVEETYHVGNKTWTPRNGSRARYGEHVTLKWGLAQSNNWVSAQLMSLLSPFALKTLIHEFGVLNQDIVPTLSLCLGPCEISVAEMVSAYTAFANNGIRISPLLVTRIDDNEGNTIAEFFPRMNEVISDKSAANMLELLKAVIDEGTGGRVRHRYGIRAEMGGKTGTTNSNSDGWFIGVTPRLISGGWVGGEEPDIHFDTMTYGQGASMALPIWALYMRKVYANKELGYGEQERFDALKNHAPCNDGEVIGGIAAEEDEEIVGIDDFFE